MRDERRRKIIEIIKSRDISTQGELVEELRALGIDAAQATVSRDIRELKLQKELTAKGNYRYAMPAERVVDTEARLRSILRQCVTSVARAQNIVVIKTLPGLAPAACSAVDKMQIKSLVGTIAGDDTAFLAMRDDDAAEEFCRRTARML